MESLLLVLLGRQQKQLKRKRMMGKEMYQLRIKKHEKELKEKYSSCHDDIGWGLDEEQERRLMIDPLLHKEPVSLF